MPVTQARQLRRMKVHIHKTFWMLCVLETWLQLIMYSAPAELNHSCHYFDQCLLYTVRHALVVIGQSLKMWSKLLDVMNQWIVLLPVATTTSTTAARVSVSTVECLVASTMSCCQLLHQVCVLVALSSHKWTDENSLTVGWHCGTLMHIAWNRIRRKLLVLAVDSRPVLSLMSVNGSVGILSNWIARSWRYSINVTRCSAWTFRYFVPRYPSDIWTATGFSG